MLDCHLRGSCKMCQGQPGRDSFQRLWVLVTHFYHELVLQATTLCHDCHLTISGMTAVSFDNALQLPVILWWDEVWKGAQFTVAGIGLSFLLCAALQSLKRRRIWWSCCPTRTSESGMTECTNGRRSKARAVTNHKSSSKMMHQCAQSTTITTSVPPLLALRDQPG